ncbi:somatostatin receptor type 2 [Lingula anatina]|uniref:Somatostatin receptor type 2 n=1 Tax=Lingula anatina TaxID=7574 RepID=A0A1S3IC93_LINAN|nr:somatostatin receptor type 2 [Lingula anatina]XP_023931368.1 somatostatin receptor type 2 [Lingula anatina]XP_023931369.1 somatostatin receptor type 2 [Lingula anatina]|eukprot:XP_013395481.1 somatostatin receptor type 2 [Lingula anatina]
MGNFTPISDVILTETLDKQSVELSFISITKYDASDYLNNTFDYQNITNITVPEPSLQAHSIVAAIMYSLIFLIGLLGNVLVLYVILRYVKMNTVTNMYICNLAVADVLFVLGIPITIATILMESWIFGDFICRVFFVTNCVNSFTSIFTLAVMSMDRYMAVCHPVAAMDFRTTKLARIICIIVWVVSGALMIPVVLYARIDTDERGKPTCGVEWPESDKLTSAQAFTWYTFLMGYAIPVALISVFYTLVVVRVGQMGPASGSEGANRTHRRVTRMVLIVIAVYIVCWMPFYIQQVLLVHGVIVGDVKMSLFNTILAYANSMMNPFLYAFFSENFKKSFLKAFHRRSVDGFEATGQPDPRENSAFPPPPAILKSCRCANGGGSNLNMAEGPTAEVGTCTEAIPLQSVSCSEENHNKIDLQPDDVDEKMLHPYYKPFAYEHEPSIVTSVDV